MSVYPWPDWPHHKIQPSDDASYRLWVNLDRTVLVRLWANGLMEVCTRDAEGLVWGPPTELEEEKV